MLTIACVAFCGKITTDKTPITWSYFPHARWATVCWPFVLYVCVCVLLLFMWVILFFALFSALPHSYNIAITRAEEVRRLQPTTVLLANAFTDEWPQAWLGGRWALAQTKKHTRESKSCGNILARIVRSWVIFVRYLLYYQRRLLSTYEHTERLWKFILRFYLHLCAICIVWYDLMDWRSETIVLALITAIEQSSFFNHDIIL